uniref:Uncharacterized protein LOC116946998 n=1 Tax=Petromyzon marinus TaxID=7757 RepID=A0AAJ7X1U9_PETMA|nr:uncharacterized protein LOC116946998 [Petromyzon marinus]
MQQDGISCQPIVSCTLACTNGRCFIDPNTKRPTCSCNIGFVLDKSQQNCFDLNECEEQPKPCEQECSNVIGSYRCSCSPGFTQDPVVANRCIDVDECQSNPCTNSGTCQNMVNKFSCHCTSGWTGVYCDEDVNECASRPCSHGGTCVNTQGSFSCTCAPGWSGNLCSLLVDECASNPCIHGTCVDQVNAFFCRCDEGWSGDTCTTNIDDCVNAQCQNGATCIDILKGYNCSCILGYTGQYCQYNIDDCIGNECQHSSTCLDGVNSYICLCPSGWSGVRCASDIDECSAGPFPCHGTLGICTNTPGSYACSCKPGYEGDGIQCFEKRLFDYGRNVHDQSPYIWDTDYVSPFFSPPYGFPFGTKFYQQLYFTDNGLIVFKENEDQSKFAYPNPTRNSWWYYTPMIAVFWDDCDFSSGIGKIYYQEYDFTVGNPSQNATQLREKVQAQVRANFSTVPDIINYVPTWMLKITWEEAPAVPANNNGRYTNTFQAILSTDGIFSFCLQIYKDGGMRWRTEVRDFNNAVMGFMSGLENSPYIEPISLSPNATVRYRPDQAVGTNTGLKGRSTLRLETNSYYTKNPKRECLKWYQSERNTPYFSPFTTCPCFYWQGYFDMSYVDGNIIQMYGYNPPYVSGASRSLQSIWPDYNGGGVRCHYSWSGSLLSGGYERYLPTPWNYWSWWWWGGAYYMQLQRQEYQQKEANPYQYCCQSGDSRLCRLYQEKRPRNQCSFYRPPFFAFLLGDPHITTLDNVSYTFNGLGEYTVLEVPGDQNHFTMQARTAIAGSNGTSKATSFVAIVAQENGSSKVEWILKDNITVVLLDSQVTQVSENKTFHNQTSVELSYGSVVASFPSGISVNVTASYGALNFITLLPQKFVNQTEGLLGVFNGDPKDDFKSKNGTVLPFDGTNVPPENQLYYDFGVTWQIAANTSLFSYNTSAGESWHTYNNNSFVPMFYEELLNRTSAKKLANVSASCGGQKDCIFDVLSTDDPNFGQATKNSAGEFGSQGQTLQNFPPNITSSGQLSTKVNSTVWAKVIAEDPNNDTIVFTLTTNSSGLTITSDGNLTWSPRSSEPAFGVVSASDGKASSALLLNLTLCNCSANSMCLSNQTTLSINGSDGSNFQVSGCLCDPGYAGVYCTDDYNACVDSPCHPGVNCTDEPAPSLGFLCGPCPAGLTGNGSKCFDVDECMLQISDCNQTCTNIINGYTCSCKDGYRNVTMDSHRCEDIDECALNSSLCVKNAHCVNTPGHYDCSCNAGFRGNGFIDCQDEDECSVKNNPCLSVNNSFCNNSIGSYSCICTSGYNGTTCEDINECISGQNNCPVNANCTNTIGSYTCACKLGYEGNGWNCKDIDECMTGNHCNSNGSECMNTDGSYYCTCALGFTGNGTYCADINECTANPYLCQDTEECMNGIGSYKCECLPGYIRNGTICTDVDECKKSQPCDANTMVCSNTIGSYTCLCKAGYQYDSTARICTDTDECVVSSLNNCSRTTGLCQNFDGSFTCQCMAGYTGDGVTCTDVDECNPPENATQPCKGPVGVRCNNTIGHYTCSCPFGYYLDSDGTTCKDVDECIRGLHNCTQNCTNIEGGFTCSCFARFSSVNGTCKPNQTCVTDVCNGTGDCYIDETTLPGCSCNSGYTLNGTSKTQCINIDECSLSVADGQTPCDSIYGTCTDTIGSFKCGCVAGYAVVSDSRTCQDVDECQSGIYNCTQYSTCHNLEGNYTCICNSGYVQSGETCIDVDECQKAGSALCGHGAYCANTLGSYACRCLVGYVGNGTVCLDVDECLLPSNNCSANSTCTNTPGSYQCQCDAGFQKTGEMCTDVDECLKFGSAACGQGAYCVNTVGSYNCPCLAGYIGNGTVCLDVDECLLPSNNCSANSTCTNTPGSYQCQCDAGFQKTGEMCTDVDECLKFGSAACGQGAYCVNTVGSYNCPCLAGYIGNGTVCLDVDECLLPSNNCSANSTCTNTPGSYQCQCDAGFQKAGEICVDVNECQTSGSAACGPGAYCVNTVGSYNCPCLAGYIGNGTVCLDVDECLLPSNNCSANSTCKNMPGSFQCQCDAGFQSNATVCEDIDECGRVPTVCGLGTVCENTVGSYRCPCAPGYQRNTSDGNATCSLATTYSTTPGTANSTQSPQTASPPRSTTSNTSSNSTVFFTSEGVSATTTPMNASFTAITQPPSFSTSAASVTNTTDSMNATTTAVETSPITAPSNTTAANTSAVTQPPSFSTSAASVTHITNDMNATATAVETSPITAPSNTTAANASAVTQPPSFSTSAASVTNTTDYMNATATAVETSPITAPSNTTTANTSAVTQPPSFSTSAASVTNTTDYMNATATAVETSPITAPSNTTTANTSAVTQPPSFSTSAASVTHITDYMNATATAVETSPITAPSNTTAANTSAVTQPPSFSTSAASITNTTDYMNATATAVETSPITAPSNTTAANTSAVTQPPSFSTSASSVTHITDYMNATATAVETSPITAPSNTTTANTSAVTQPPSISTSAALVTNTTDSMNTTTTAVDTSPITAPSNTTTSNTSAVTQPPSFSTSAASVTHITDYMNATATAVETSPITVPSNTTAVNTSAVDSTTASTTRVGTESTLVTVNMNTTGPVALTEVSNATSKTTVTSVTTAAMSTIGPNGTNVTLPILGTSNTTNTATMVHIVTTAAPNSSTGASTSAISPATSNTTAAYTAVGSTTTSITTLRTNSTTVTALTNQSTSTAVTQPIVNSPTSYTTIISTVSSSTASTTNATVTPNSTISIISTVTSPTTASTSTTVSNSGTTPTSNGTTQSTTTVITSSISPTPSSATTVSTTSVPTTAAIVVPGLVKNLTLTSQGVKNTSLEVVWLAAEGYVEQYIAFISPQEASAVSVSPNGSLTARFSALRPGVEYTITVKTFGRGNVSNAGVSVKQVTALTTCNIACTNGQCFIDAKTSMSTCYCNSGFSLTSPQICSDVDECQSRPCKHGGSCANTQGSYSCSCVSGWSGLNCTENIDDCAGSVCQNSATCLDGDNSYTCICRSGWRGVNCSEDVDECIARPCHATRATCTNTAGSFSCKCNAGYEGDGVQCIEKRLFEYGPTVGDTTMRTFSTDSVSPFFSPPYGFPFASKFYQRLYFTDNGLIIFKNVEDSTQFAYPNPFINGFTESSSIPMIAVFWDDADFSSETGNMYFQEYDFNQGLSNNTDALTLRGKVMEQIQANFSSQSDTHGYEPTWMLKITWAEAPAVPARSNYKYTNTFQAVLSTDGDSSFCLIFFKDGGMQWRPEARDPGSNNALMGFNSGTNRFYYNDALSRPTNPARYRPDTVIGNNTGLKGRWAYRLDTNLAVTTNPKRKCMDWYRNELALPSISRFTTCPCSLWQGQFDMSYINGDISRYGYQPPNVTGSFWSLQSFNKDRFGGGVRCHYNKFGALVSGSYERYLPTPWVTNTQQDIQLYSTNETEPYRSCCQSGDARFCRLYQQKRPPNQCAFYRPPFAAFLIGDPHITTLDNVSYTFNGLGEYTVLEAVGDGVNFTMQGRTGIARTNASTNISSKATSFIAIVAQETGGIKVEWILKNSSIVVLVDGKQINSTDAIYNQTMSINWSDGHVVATFASGISLNVSSVSGALNFITSLQESFINRTKGLLGVFNKDPTDDFQASNGTVLRFNGSSVPPESQIYYSFGITWQTKPSTSLFTYNATSGETWSTFNNNSFVPTFYEELINQTSAKQLADIQELCGGQFDCIFDMLSTGDSTFALATSQSAMEFGSQQKALQNFPPNITSDGQISTMLNQVVTVKISAVDSNNDTIVFTISRNSSDLNITADGTLTWSPRSSEPAFGVVSASNGKASSSLLLNLTLCNCSANSTCNYHQTTLSITGSDGSTFQVSGCLCDPGYTGVYCTDDYNACVDSPCHPGVNCTDEPAPSLGFSCGPCPVGLTGNGSKCYDVDECLEVPAKCNQTCLNNNNGFTCSCNIGYINTTIDSSTCQDMNECALNSSLCAENGVCFNTPGSYECNCKEGYQGVGSVLCQDINECNAAIDPCLSTNNSYCLNTPGSYKCNCSPGYNGTNCTDINECNAAIDPCLSTNNSYCLNTPGSYKCNCSPGYNGTNCTDINECNAAIDPCLSTNNSYCLNTPGSYKCNCSPGYNGTNCTDINECNAAIDPCLSTNNSYCLNTPGSYKCNCSPGYNGTNCTDINECAIQNACHTNATCSNSEGSYNCTCKQGFTGDGRMCSDINECLTNCIGQSAQCVNTIGSYICSCANGYIDIGNNNPENGINCVDIDECKTMPCPQYEECYNIPGTYMCNCSNGYKRDGQECVPLNCSQTACIGGFCKNGGTCFNTPQCTAECKCQASYYGTDCQYGKTTINASIKTGAPKLKAFMKLNCSISPTPTNTIEELASAKILTKLTPLSYFNYFYNNNITNISSTDNKVFFVESYAQFNYTTESAVFDYYTNTLETDIRNQFNTRAVESMVLVSLTKEQLSKDELKQYINCSTTMLKYVPIWIDGIGFVCQSPCITEIYCKNGGECQHTSKGPVCTCAPNGIYHSDGDQCQHLTVTSPAFFGILFGSLGGMLLLGIGIYAFWRYKSGRTYTLFGNKGSLNGSHPGSASAYDNYSREGAIKGTHAAETEVYGVKSDLAFTSWRPVIRDINTTKISIQRPSVLKGCSDSEQAFHDLE